MTVTEALNRGTARLDAAAGASPSLDAEVLLCAALGWTKAELISNRTMQVPAAKLDRYDEMLKERATGVPVAYLTGFKEFFGLKFLVNRHVLIPRPETESLVDRMVFELKNRHNLRILDIGTGSGCIIVSLAKSLSNMNRYFASDSSQRAVATAQENAALHRVKVEFMRSDLTRTTGTDYDVIVANLPYLPAITDPSVKFEPKAALVAKKGGLELYEKLLKEIAESGHRPLIFLEFGHDQQDQIQALARKLLPGALVEFFKDLYGVPRFARIWQKSAA